MARRPGGPETDSVGDVATKSKALPTSSITVCGIPRSTWPAIMPSSLESGTRAARKFVVLAENTVVGSAGLKPDLVLV